MKLYFIEFDEEGISGFLFAPVAENETQSLFCTHSKEDAEKHAEMMQEAFPDTDYKLITAEVTFT